MGLFIFLKRKEQVTVKKPYGQTQEEILEQLLEADACFSLKQLAVNGGDMMRLGITGRPIGVILNALLDAVVNGELPNERSALTAAAEALAKSKIGK